jgi:carbamoyltransferase
MVINTSFNVRGEPPVCSPQDAIRCFLATDMDVLVMQNVVLLKTEQPEEQIALAKSITFEKD